LRQALLVGAARQAQGGVADLELGVAEQLAVALGDEGAGHVQEVLLGRLGQGAGELLGLGFLLGGQRFLHGILTEGTGGFLAETAHSSFVYKESTNFRDAYTRSALRGEKC